MTIKTIKEYFTPQDKEYADDYEKPSKAFSAAHAHIKKSNYKVNHDGHTPEGHKPHAKPDITLHYARGDDSPNSYTVHKNGAAAKDKKLHQPDLHKEEYTSQDFYADYISLTVKN